MAHKNKVMRSISQYGEAVCVDFFQRPDGTFGFDEFRRDPEDARGWYSIGNYGEQVFADVDAALSQARASVRWLSEQV